LIVARVSATKSRGISKNRKRVWLNAPRRAT